MAALESIMMKVAAGIGAVLLVELAVSVRRVKRGNIPRSKLVGHAVSVFLTLVLAWVCSNAGRTIVVSTCKVATWFNTAVPSTNAGHMLALSASVAGAVACCGVGAYYSSGLTIAAVVHKGRTDGFRDLLS
ncbi:unnamed protein product [Prorocentrum cordatum]|uniref:H(+)-exporting diphosphatase n=1 Tax=Prorocentrum cordatum TaxID=2364126 RepID=A0ABN9PN48_9DINO|nr:unnamed protein product [Polarella glacialis]